MERGEKRRGRKIKQIITDCGQQPTPDTHARKQHKRGAQVFLKRKENEIIHKTNCLAVPYQLYTTDM